MRAIHPRREDHCQSMPVVVLIIVKRDHNATGSRNPSHIHPKHRDERKPFDPRQRHWQSRFTKEASQAMVVSPELLALLACLSATFPMESSRLLKIDAQIICPTGPRSLEWETRRRATGGPKSNCSSRGGATGSTYSILSLIQ